MKHRCYALVIGINNYTNNTTLTNAVNDALGVAQTFRELRYEVKCLENSTFDEFIEAYDNLRLISNNYTVIIIFFAGHGMMSNAADYIVFSDAENMDTHGGMKATRKSYRIDDIYKELRQDTNAIVITIIDACRVDKGEVFRGGHAFAPFGKNTSLPYQTYIAFSTSPDAPAKDGITTHSPFTQALLEEIPKEGQSIEKSFKNVRKKIYQGFGSQLPWDHSCLVDEFCFNHGQLNPHYRGPYSNEVYNFSQIEADLDGRVTTLLCAITKNPYKSIVNEINSTLSEIDEDSQFVLGKLLIDKCAENNNLLKIFTPQFFSKTQNGKDNHVLNGFLYGFYADTEDNLRPSNYFDNDIVNLVGLLGSIKDNKSSLNFLKQELSEFHDDILYIINLEDCRIDVKLKQTDNYCSCENLFCFDDIIVNYMDIELTEHDLYTRNSLLEEIQAQYNIPKSKQRLVSSPILNTNDILVRIDFNLQSLLNEYVIINGINTLDEMGHHYEFFDLYNVEISNAEAEDDTLYLNGSFDINAIIYGDSEEEIKFDVNFDGTYELALVCINDQWKIDSAISLKINTDSFYH